MFDGGLDNPLCDANGDGTAAEGERATDTERAALAGFTDPTAAQTAAIAACASKGDATVDPTNTADTTYRFDLKKGAVARDRQSNTQPGVGLIAANDIMSLVVNGRTAEPSADGSAPSSAGTGPWFTVVEGGTVAGGGIIAVVIHALEPQDADNSVSITFKDTEFKFDSHNALGP